MCAFVLEFACVLLCMGVSGSMCMYVELVILPACVYVCTCVCIVLAWPITLKEWRHTASWGSVCTERSEDDYWWRHTTDRES